MIYGDEITRKTPDTRLAFRVWRYDRRRSVLLSVNAGQPVRKGTWMLPNAISSPEGEWPKGQLMLAQCAQGNEHERGVPDPKCSCGIYAATDLGVVNQYLSVEAPVLGVVELGGHTMCATSGYRAQAVRVAAILLVDPMFTLSHNTLRKIAAEYKVPALEPHSTDPEDYRSLLHLGDLGEFDWDGWLKLLMGEADQGTP